MWDIPNVKSNHPEKTEHPCQFPIELVERCVLALTDENSWVLDPFAGVGSTVTGAINNKHSGKRIRKEDDCYKTDKKKVNLSVLISGRVFRCKPSFVPHYGLLDSIPKGIYLN